MHRKFEGNRSKIMGSDSRTQKLHLGILEGFDSRERFAMARVHKDLDDFDDFDDL